MNILVTGGAGFIGSYLCRKLLQRGDGITILDIANPNPDNHPAKAEYRQGDICNPAHTSEALHGKNLVIQLAAKHRFIGISKEEVCRVNVEGTETIRRSRAK